MTQLLQSLLLLLLRCNSLVSLMIFNNTTSTSSIINVTFIENNHSFQLIIDNYTKTITSIGHNVDLYFHIPDYSRILSMHYPAIQPHDSYPLLDKLQITFLSSQVLVIPTTITTVNTTQSQQYPMHYYYLKALFKETGSYRMFIRLECGSLDYMTIPYTNTRNNNITYFLESRTYVNNNNFTIDIDADEEVDEDSSKTEREESRYCTATEAFHGRFYINNIDFLDKNIHNGDIYSIFKPYNCQLRIDDMKNSSILLNLLTNQHIIFLGDSTMGMVFKGIVERIFGIGILTKENNSKQWRENNEKQLQGGKAMYENRLFDIDRSNVRLSYMFNGAPIINYNGIGAIVDDFTTNIRWEAYRNQLRKIIHSSIEQCRSITIFFNSGLHDIYTFEKATDHNLYGRNLKHAVNYLQALIKEEIMKVKLSFTKNDNNNGDKLYHHSYNHHHQQQQQAQHHNVCINSLLETTTTTYFWVKTVPTLGVKICLGGYVRQLNEIASKVMKRFGIRVLDVYSMLTGFPQDSDGAHCLKDYMLPSIPYNSYSCNRLVDSYLHAILSKDIS